MDGDTGLTVLVIAAAIDVHRELGPGLLESALSVLPRTRDPESGQRVETEVPLALAYRELKAVRALEALHTAQLLTYLRLAGQPLGLLINFNVPVSRQGIRRVVLSSVAFPS